VAQVVEQQPSKHEALSSNTSTKRKKEGRKEKRKKKSIIHVIGRHNSKKYWQNY
jgi:hypothetical protein